MPRLNVRKLISYLQTHQSHLYTISLLSRNNQLTDELEVARIKIIRLITTLEILSETDSNITISTTDIDDGGPIL